jgi:hypothetical protein
VKTLLRDASVRLAQMQQKAPDDAGAQIVGGEGIDQ